MQTLTFTGKQIAFNIEQKKHLPPYLWNRTPPN